MLLNLKCVFRFSLQLLSEKFFILKRSWRDMMKKNIDLDVQSDFNEP